MEMVKRLSASVVIFVVCILPVVATSLGVVNSLHRRTATVMEDLTKNLKRAQEAEQRLRQQAPDSAADRSAGAAEIVKLLGIEDPELSRYIEGVVVRRSFDEEYEDISTYRREHLWYAGTPVVVLTLLPFAFIAARLAEKQLMAPSKRAWAGNWSEALAQAHRAAVMKALLAIVVAWAWVYILHERGIGASALHAFIKEREPTASESLPILMDKAYTIKPLLAAGLGFYLYMAGYLFNRARQDDVRSAQVYGVLFRKVLFTAGITVMISAAAGDQAAILGFLVGFIPSSWVGILKALSARGLGAVDDPTAAMRELPGMSPDRMARLEEEGIDSISALLRVPASELEERVPLQHVDVEMWYDVAILLHVLGLERYQRVKPYCLTASHFVKEAESEEQRARLRDGAQIHNVPEIAAALKSQIEARKALSG